MAASESGVRCPHEKRDGERQRTARNILDARETAVMHLLHAADIVEVDDADIARVFEVALGGIDEGKMAILADAERGQHGRLAGQEPVVTIGLGGKVGRIAGEFVEGDRGETLAQESAERRRMAGG